MDGLATGAVTEAVVALAGLGAIYAAILIALAVAVWHEE